MCRSEHNLISASTAPEQHHRGGREYARIDKRNYAEITLVGTDSGFHGEDLSSEVLVNEVTCAAGGGWRAHPGVPSVMWLCGGWCVARFKHPGL